MRFYDIIMNICIGGDVIMLYDNIVKFWQSKNIITSDELAVVLENHSISFAYNSGKIENDNITFNDTREIFDKDGVVSYTGDLRTLFEIRNSKDAYNFLLDIFDEKPDLDIDLLCRFQYELTKNTYDERRWRIGERPGEFKKHDYVTGINETGALPEDVPEEISDLIDEVNNEDNNNILTIAAYFHCKFENIHPFADGNGRTGRLLMNYLLLKNNHPPITIHEEDRKDYFTALEHWDEEQELSTMIDFLKAQSIKTWEKQINRARDTR